MTEEQRVRWETHLIALHRGILSEYETAFQERNKVQLCEMLAELPAKHPAQARLEHAEKVIRSILEMNNSDEHPSDFVFYVN